MKRNVKFFTIVISLLLLSSIILAGCMYAIASDNGEMKPYDLNGQKENSDSSDGNVVEDAPQAQKPLHGRFGEYLHEDGTAVTVFSEEQYAELKEVRESDKRNPLTYEEILFLVNDSINLYFAYDEIRLYNANVDRVLPLTLTFASIQSSSGCIISPYHGDFSEFEVYAEALSRYERMLQEIYAIIYYRIYMHDAGFTHITRSFDEVIAPSECSEFFEDHKSMSSLLLTNIYQMLAIDGSTVSGTENGDRLASEFQKIVEWEVEVSASYIDPNKKEQSLDAPILCTEIWHSVRTPLKHQFYIYESNRTMQLIFPTKELTARKPQQTVTYQAGEEGELQPVVHLNYKTGGARISAGMEFSFAMTGKFRLEDGVLKVYFGESESNPDYCYVFYETDEGFAYSAANSKTSNIGRGWADGLVFKKYCEQVVVQPEIVPPVNDKTEPDIDEEQWAYLKYASGSDYATLMYPDGGQYIAEGSYAKEADKLVFVFKTADGVYTYYFHYRKDRVYVFDKELSEAVPGYGFEDEMEFVLTEYEGGSCFLELLELKEGHPTDTHAEDFERYYPDELFNLYDLSKIVTWDEIYAAEEKLLENNKYFYNEQLPPLYLFIKELNIRKEDFIKATDDISEEQIDLLFSDADIETIMKNLKADWAFYHEGRLYNIFELAELDKDLIIELRECGALNEFIAYMESLDVEFEALEIIKNVGK